MSWPAIQAAMDVYEGDAPCADTIRHYVLAAGLPKKPRGVPFKVSELPQGGIAPDANPPYGGVK